MPKAPLIALLLVVLVAGVGGIVLARRPAPQPFVPVLPTPAPDTTTRPFTLLAHTGKPFSDGELRGKIALIYFGYTFCPDVCPTELGYLAKVMRALGADADKVQPVFITVDPQRDTREKLAEYVPLFDKHLIGLTGTPAEIDALAKVYGVFHQRTNVVTKQDGYYLIDHSSTIFVLDATGQLVDTFDSDAPLPATLGRIRRLFPKQE